MYLNYNGCWEWDDIADFNRFAEDKKWWIRLARHVEALIIEGKIEEHVKICDSCDDLIGPCEFFLILQAELDKVKGMG